LYERTPGCPPLFFGGVPFFLCSCITSTCNPFSQPFVERWAFSCFPSLSSGALSLPSDPFFNTHLCFSFVVGCSLTSLVFRPFFPPLSPPGKGLCPFLCSHHPTASPTFYKREDLSSLPGRLAAESGILSRFFPLTRLFSLDSTRSLRQLSQPPRANCCRITTSVFQWLAAASLIPSLASIFPSSSPSEHFFTH